MNTAVTVSQSDGVHQINMPALKEYIDEYLGQYTSNIEEIIESGERNENYHFCPNGIIMNPQVFSKLMENLNRIKANRDVIPNPKNENKWIGLLSTMPQRNNDFYKKESKYWTKEEFEYIKNKHIEKIERINRKIFPIQQLINELNVWINNEKNRITKIATLRGNTPTYSQDVINKEREVQNLEQKKNILISKREKIVKPDLLNNFVTYYQYSNCVEEYEKELSSYQKKIAPFIKDFEFIYNLILIEIWRMPYIHYSRFHNIDVDETSDDIFIICNKHRSNYLELVRNCKYSEYFGGSVGNTLGFIIDDDLCDYTQF